MSAALKRGEVIGLCDIQRMTRRQEFASERVLVLRNIQ